MLKRHEFIRTGLMDAFATWPQWDLQAFDRSAINVWGIRLSAGMHEVDRLREVLSDAERARARRFGSQADSARYVLAHGALHEILGAVTGKPPASIAFALDDHGRPRLAPASDTGFNLSHAGEVALVAIGQRTRVGVDVELTTRDVDGEHMAKRFFAPEEANDVAVRGRSAFFDYWCKKEAVAKAVGIGVSISLSSFVVTPEQEQEVDVPGLGSWHVCRLQPGGEYVAAVAAERPLPVVTWRWQPGRRPA